MAILVCADTAQLKFEGFWPQDCAAAMENMLLASTARELGSVWLGIYPNEERVAAMAAHVGTPAHIVPFALMPLGHPDEEKPYSDRYDPSRVRQERW